MSPAALALALLLAAPSTGAKDAASGLLPPEAYAFEKPLQCGKHLLPPSICYPEAAFGLLDNEFKRLQAVEKDAKVAGDRRLTFFVIGTILGTALGLTLGGVIAWLVIQ